MMMYNLNIKETIKKLLVPKTDVGKFVMFVLVVILMGIGYMFIR